MAGGALAVGIIGCGKRIAGVAKQLAELDPAIRIAAVADPQGPALREKYPDLLKETEFVPDADRLLKMSGLAGVMIGTRCRLHAPLATQVAAAGLPLFLEKPVAITTEQAQALRTAYAAPGRKPVLVSFPLRVSPLLRKAKALIDAGELGTVEHAVVFNDVPYGDVYFGGWYRDYAETGGLFLQKATHDLDALSYLLDARPRRVAAMTSQRVWGGDHPFELMCKDCNEKLACPESPFNPDGLVDDPNGNWKEWRKCLFADGIRNEDSGNALLEFDTGVQASYTQNFFARRNAARRGARLYGYKATLEFDWYTGKILVHRHDKAVTDTFVPETGDAHFGGDIELVKNFAAMLRGAPSIAPIDAGLLSAFTCLACRESAETRRFVEVDAARTG